MVQQKSIAFWKLPKILIIFLKRYNNSNMKLNSNIDFPLTDLDMSKYVLGYNKSKYIYDLYAVSNHVGGSFGGHYYAYCKNNDNNWIIQKEFFVSLSLDQRIHFFNKFTNDVLTLLFPELLCSLVSLFLIVNPENSSSFSSSSL